MFAPIRWSWMLLLLMIPFLMFACDDGGDDPVDGDSTDGDQVDGDGEWADTEEEGEQAAPLRMVDWVDPFIGTGGPGFNVGSGLPGPTAPFGMIYPSPDTRKELGAEPFYHCSGYYADDDIITGFSHTHLYGVGAQDLGHVMLMPTTNAITNDSVKPNGYWSFFDKETEEARPGYYAVTLKDTDIRVELTATTRAAHHRYTFPQSAQSKEVFVLLDHYHAVDDTEVTEGDITIDSATQTIEGWLTGKGGFTGRYGGLSVYYVMQFNRPFSSTGTFKDWTVTADATEVSGTPIGAYLGFDVSDGEPVEARVAISYVSIEEARNNLNIEMPDWDFDTAAQELEDTWEQELSVVSFTGGTDSQRTMMATALYHAFYMPDTFTDQSGKYIGFDKQVHEAQDFTYYTNFSMWDTYRSLHSLLTLLKPERQRDMLTSLVTMYEQGGYLPKWPMGAGYTNCMNGSPADVVIADSYVKGITDFDAEKAFEGMLLTANAPVPPEHPYSGRSDIQNYIDLGYATTNTGGPVARTQEFAVADYAISQMAAAMGKTDEAEIFLQRSKNYKNLWHSDYKFFWAKRPDGTWLDDFDPLQFEIEREVEPGGRKVKAYTEGNAWHYRFLAPHDPEGLAELFGSNETMAQELNTFFEKAAIEREERQQELEDGYTLNSLLPPTYYWHGNEPDIHAAYLFARVGRADLTQKWVHWIAEHLYGDGVDGVPGNDDCGTLSAWYVFSALGFFPMPGSDLYIVGSPFFPQAEINLPGGVLKIEAPDASLENIYVQSVSFNGEELESPWFTHDMIASGGTLHFEMGPEPGSWGVDN